MPTTNYYVTTNELPNLLQLQYVSLDYDTSVNDAAVYLPELSTVEASLIEIQIANIGGGTVTIIPFANALAVPPVQNRISGAITFPFTGSGKFYTLRINQVDGVNTEWAIEQPLSISVAALNRATLATPTYINYPIGFEVFVLNYNATAKGCSIVKKSIVNSTFADWIVTGTEATISTGGFGVVPAA